MKLISVVSAEYKDNFKILIQFNDGLKGIIDLKNYLDGDIFIPLKNQDFFKRFTLDTWTIGWENGANFTPEFLYEFVKTENILN